MRRKLVLCQQVPKLQVSGLVGNAGRTFEADDVTVRRIPGQFLFHCGFV
jgi:hypothetical protein